MSDQPPPWVEPSDLVRVRADLDLVQGRIDRANRQLQLSAQLAARMQALLQAPAASELLPSSPSPARQAAELEATQILLQAELRAGEIISGAPGTGPAANGPAALEVRPEVAQVVEERIWAFADVENRLIELATKALQRDARIAHPRRGRSAGSGPQSGRGRRNSPALASPTSRDPDLANPTLSNSGPGQPERSKGGGRSSRLSKKGGLRGVSSGPAKAEEPPEGGDGQE